MSSMIPVRMDIAFCRKRQAHQRRLIIFLAFFLSVILTTGLILLKGTLLVPVCALIVFATVGVAWQYPQSTYYVMLTGACVVETYAINLKDSVTDQIPLFWDINTAVQVYFRLNNFHGIALSFFEIYMLVAALSWVLHGVIDHTLKLDLGTLILPISLYIVCVIGGLLNGFATGGVFNIELFEVRAQFYFLFAYLMAVNATKDVKAQLGVLLWTSALAIGFKGLLCSYRFIVTFKGSTIPEIGIGAHEESFFFDCFIFQFLVLKMTSILPKLRRVMLYLMPFVILANLANQRRAATAALVLALIVMLVLGAVALPKRRRAIGIAALFIAGVLAIYLPVFWNGTGTIAQPARAIKSQFSPDPRDASSNAYRDAENSNLMYTMRSSPILGYGFGKPIREDVKMVDLTSVDPLIHYMTHDQILWVWMRLGTIGFYAFWVMICGIIMHSCRLLRHPNATIEAKTAALICIVIIVMEMVFALLDLQLTNMRNMLYCGLWVGTLSAFSSVSGDAPVVRKPTLKFRGKRRVIAKWNVAPQENIEE
jgi:hypothetical protein